jgi:hypothetical protein
LRVTISNNPDQSIFKNKGAKNALNKDLNVVLNEVTAGKYAKAIDTKKRRGSGPMPNRPAYVGSFLIEKFVRCIVYSLFQDILGYAVKLFSASRCFMISWSPQSYPSFGPDLVKFTTDNWRRGSVSWCYMRSVSS